mmetsp:Transcript_61795/g.146124  ORF Transcript_61795/g.146124 Transcript_61795/m.146124 type:complete len:282 (+) Transcript_61795:779-1624(+)
MVRRTTGRGHGLLVSSAFGHMLPVARVVLVCHRGRRVLGALLRGRVRRLFVMSLVALRHQAVLHLPGHHPDVDGVGDRKAGDDAHRHHTPKEHLGRLHGAHVPTHHQQGHHRRHPSHHGVHADELGHERLAHVLPVAAAHHVFHEQRLEDEQAESEARHVLHDQVDPHRQPERCRHDRGQDDPGRVACDTVDRRAHALLPKRLDEDLVLARRRLLVRHHVQQQPDRPHVEGHQHEPPLHHHGLGVVAKLVPCHVGRIQAGEREPDDQEIVDGLDDHGFSES